MLAAASLLVGTLKFDGLLVLLCAPTLLMTSCLALGLVNWLVTLTMPANMLPRLDYSEGIPTDACTLVVVPTLIGSALDVDELVEGMEVRYLANRDSNLHFALLTDFLDAASAELPQDAEQLQLARQQLAGQLLRAVAQNNSLATLLTQNTHQRQPDDHLNTYIDRLTALTPEGVREVMQRRFDLTRKVLVSVGPTCQQGQSEGLLPNPSVGQHVDGCVVPVRL